MVTFDESGLFERVALPKPYLTVADCLLMNGQAQAAVVAGRPKRLVHQCFTRERRR